jgi:hypothetical protein
MLLMMDTRIHRALGVDEDEVAPEGRDATPLLAKCIDTVGTFTTFCLTMQHVLNSDNLLSEWQSSDALSRKGIVQCGVSIRI